MKLQRIVLSERSNESHVFIDIKMFKNFFVLIAIMQMVASTNAIQTAIFCYAGKILFNSYFFLYFR